MTPRRWIIGRGLLGNAVARQRPDVAFRAEVPWRDQEGSRRALGDALDDFMSETSTPLQVFWCAGQGVTSTPRDRLDQEVAVFESFLDALKAAPASVRERISFFLASSVGGAYAGTDTRPLTENSPTAPASDYGRAKLRMEDALRSASQSGGWRSVIGRLTNIYGPGQDLGKGQGLISVVAGSFMTGRPVRIYVSLDTLRDYIYEDDCAAIVAAAVDRIGTAAPGTVVTKIVGSMNSISIAAIIGESNRLRGRRGPVIVGANDPRGQALDLRVRSEVWTDLDALASTTFSAGFDAVYRAQLRALGAKGIPA